MSEIVEIERSDWKEALKAVQAQLESSETAPEPTEGEEVPDTPDTGEVPEVPEEPQADEEKAWDDFGEDDAQDSEAPPSTDENDPILFAACETLLDLGYPEDLLSGLPPEKLLALSRHSLKMSAPVPPVNAGKEPPPQPPPAQPPPQSVAPVSGIDEMFTPEMEEALKDDPLYRIVKQQAEVIKSVQARDAAREQEAFSKFMDAEVEAAYAELGPQFSAFIGESASAPLSPEQNAHWETVWATSVAIREGAAKTGRPIPRPKEAISRAVRSIFGDQVHPQDKKDPKEIKREIITQARRNAKPKQPPVTRDAAPAAEQPFGDPAKTAGYEAVMRVLGRRKRQ